ncbi:hypothetical protein CC2G_001146 [Coprinopsis cinerea AmutBmut pab1-1]|nr:hypothetical protein CC2G_001146 [Coprinopsis cinerea AmutBmut pab1-1]
MLSSMPQTIMSADPSPASPFSIPFGIIIGLLASFVQSLGLTIQRKSHVLNQALPEHRRKVEHRRPLWLLGFAIFISSNVLGSLVQIAALPVVILAPLGAVSLLWNAFFARWILGDVFSPWMILGTILIAGGAVLIAVFGIVPEPTRSLEDLLELFRRPAFAAYFSVLVFVVLLSLGATHIAEFALSRKLGQNDDDWEASALLTLSSNIIDLSATDDPPRNDGIPGPASFVADETTPLLQDVKPNGTTEDTNSRAGPNSLHRTRILIAISYASFSGILSGMCLIFAKSGVQLLLLTLGGQNQFWRWESWVLVLGLVVFALLQLWYLHKALILADPTLVCPSAFCFYNLSSILNGLVYFNQLSLIRPLHLLLVSLGIIVLLCGVWVVSIQAGGGVVDVTPWTDEPEEMLCNEAVSREEDEETCLQEVPVSRPSGPPRIGPVPLDRGTRSESSVPNINASTFSDLHPHKHHRVSTDSEASQPCRRRRGSTTSDVSQHRLSRRNTTHLPTSPSLGSRYSLKHRLASVGNELYRHSHGSTTHGGPLSPPLNPAGFQIGLSPVSPGFAIMPMERRSRHSQQQAGLGLGLPPGSSNRRRTVSEGDAAARNGLNADDGELEGGAGDEQERGEGADGAEEGLQRDRGSDEDSSRWTRWMVNIFRSKS